MRIVLVHPAGSNWMPGQKDVTTAANRMAPVGLLSMAAFLEARGYDVRAHDCLGPGAPRGPLANAKAILAMDPEIVGFSTTTSAFHDADDMAVAIKASRPEVRVVFGGVHVSAVGATLLERFPSIDYLCIGEGEETLAELAEGRPPAGIAGLAWRDAGEIRVNPPRARIEDLDALPFPAYEKLRGFPRGYHLPPFSYVHAPGTTLITSRGCVYQCTYCDRSVFQKSFRSNSADYIYEHMRHLCRRFGVRHINVYDDLFTTNRKRIAELCERLAAAPLGVRFNCAVHAGHADDELLALLKRAGCLMISVGMESGDAELLARHKGSVTLERVRETVARIQANGMRAKGLFMMGLPGETAETFRRTSDFIISLGLDDMNLSKFTPFPGAPCYAGIRDEGDFDEDWRRMNCLNFVFVPKGFRSREEMDALYNTHVKRFYSDREWRRKFRRRLWQHRRTLLHFVRHLPSFLAAKRQFENRPR
jgi:anaerobic magnesium-protoporphyrin IX monomethyl ester cyclase